MYWIVTHAITVVFRDHQSAAGIILGMASDNDRWRYIVTLSLISWAHTQKNPLSATHLDY